MTSSTSIIKNTVLWFILTVVLIGVVASTVAMRYVYLFRNQVNQNRTAFQTVQLLDTELEVIQKMGDPTSIDIKNRVRSESPRDLKRFYQEYTGLDDFECHHQYNYCVTLLNTGVYARWIIVFDKQGRVVCKYRLD